MTTEHETSDKNTSWLGLGAALAAIAASVCCVGPFLLLSLGIGGAWISTLTSLSTVRPVFLILTLVFIGLAYRKLYLIQGICKDDEVCVSPEVEQKQRTIFWVVSVFILLLLAFPWYAPFFME